MKSLPVSLLGALCAATVAHANIYEFTGSLNGATEVPPNASPATGIADIKYNDVTLTLSVDISFSGLLGTTTGSHIHAVTSAPFTGNSGVALPFSGFPTGVTSGSYSHTFDLTLPATFTAGFVSAHGGTTAGADAALLAAMESGESYVNIHTSVAPSGEIRGFLTQVPELNATWAAGAVAAAFGIWMKRRNASVK